MKKKILIVLPGCNKGGVLSSLLALIHSEFVKKYEVSLFVVNPIGIEQYHDLQSRVIGRSRLLICMHADKSSLKGIYKIIAICMRVIHKIPFAGNSIYDFIQNYIVKKIEYANKFDCIISYQESISVYFVSKFTNPNKITWIHCDYSRGISNQPIEKYVYSKYRKIICVSKATKESFLKVYPEFSDKVEYVYNIADYSDIIQKSKMQISDLNFIKSTFTMISVGRICKVKRFDIIPKIACELKMANCKFVWYIIGRAVEGTAFSSIMKNIKEYDVEDCVKVVGEKANPYPFFKSADLLVSTSISEACPMIFNEAKILNLPIISSDFPSAYEFIVPGKDGYICDIDTMPVIIKQVIQNGAMYRSLKPDISEIFSADTIVSKIDNIINA